MTTNLKGLPPRSYTREALPPAKPEVQAILDRVYTAAEKLRSDATKFGTLPKNMRRNGQASPSDQGKRLIKPTDKGKRLINLP